MTLAVAVEPPALEGLKEAIVDRSGRAPIGYGELLALASELAADADANQRVALAARAVWELLSQEELKLTR